MGNHHLKLLFVHVPKTGGTSVKMAMRAHFGAGLIEDYDDHLGDPRFPASFDRARYLSREQEPCRIRAEGAAAVVGHLHAAKYATSRFDIRAAVLREPIRRALSNYYFWLSGHTSDHPIHNYVVEQGLSFMEYASLPIVNRLYSEVFFDGVDMGSFEVVATHDSVSTDWRGLCAQLGIDSPELHYNSTSEYCGDYRQRVGDVLADARAMANLSNIFADDIRFYERHARHRLTMAA